MSLTGVMRFRSLARTFGLKAAISVERQKRTRPTVSVGDYTSWNDPSTTYHLLESMPKLRRLAEYVSTDASAVVDVGAHSGLFATFAKERAPGAEVICIEANPQLAPVIRQNLARFSHWTLVTAAASDHLGDTSTLYRSRKSSQATSLDREAVEQFDEAPSPIEVQTVTLDAVCAGIPKIDVLKIDVQGAEQQVLDGAQDVLRRVSVLLIEASFLDHDVHRMLTRLYDEFGAPTMVNPVFAGADLAYTRSLGSVDPQP